MNKQLSKLLAQTRKDAQNIINKIFCDSNNESVKLHNRNLSDKSKLRTISDKSKQRNINAAEKRYRRNTGNLSKKEKKTFNLLEL